VHARLAPGAVSLRRVSRGPRRRTLVAREAAVEAVEDARDWRGAAAAFEAELAAAGWRNADLTVSLATDFVRFDIVPWSDDLEGEREVEAFARHRLQATYGEAAVAWRVALARGRPGCSRIVAAVEGELVDALAAIARRHGLRLAALRPGLVGLIDASLRGLGREGFWFAAAEPGRLALLRAANGQWAGIETVAAGSDPGQALLGLLARAAFDAGNAGEPRVVHVHGLGAAVATRLSEAGWQVKAVAAAAQEA